MELSKQCTSLELSKKLKELGVKQESLYSWYRGVGNMMILGTNVEVLKNGVQISRTTAPQFEEYSAFTVAELGEILKDKTKFLVPKSNQGGMPWYNEKIKKWERYLEKGAWILTDTEVDARAKLYIYLLKNNLITSEVKE